MHSSSPPLRHLTHRLETPSRMAVRMTLKAHQSFQRDHHRARERAFLQPPAHKPLAKTTAAQSPD